MSDELTDDQLLRYSRQIMLPQFDIEGQLKISNATVVIVGAGGLGNPSAMYLASSGIGRLIIVDDDQVDTTNLQRQVAFSESQVGVSKAEALSAKLSENNSAVDIECLNYRLTEEQLVDRLASVSVVLDCTDNFQSRFMINRACLSANVPLVSAAAIGFEGQLSVYHPGHSESPCYQCLYGEVEEQELTCSESGVLGPVVGSMGVLQALEAIKVIAGVGEPLIGRLQVFDALSHEWRTIKLKKDPACPACSHV
jgi:adenylyltransferase/sulfurtransferase